MGVIRVVLLLSNIIKQVRFPSMGDDITAAVERLRELTTHATNILTENPFSSF